MRKIAITLVLSFVFTGMTMAQKPAGAPAGAPANGQGARPAAPTIGRAYGKVTDSAGQPIAQASVLLMKQTTDPASKKKKLTLLKGMETQANGEFDFEELPVGAPLVVKITASGYKGHDQTFVIIPTAASSTPQPASQNNSANPLGNLPSFEKDLGVTKLTADVKELGSVTVTAKQPVMKLELDKKVFNVDRNIVSAGGTAVDVMRNVPSVNVDLDGNVTLRGASPTIFVDGRPTTLTLDEIPADAIESVEVMTNPSAKYDASGGGAGILNIVLKKNRKQGYNGSINAGIDSHGAPNALVSLSARQQKFNISMNGLINGFNGKTTGTTDRNTFFTDTVTHLQSTHLTQNDLQRNKGHFLFGQIGLDYFVTNKTTISVGYIKVHGSLTPTDASDIRVDSIFPSNITTQYSLRGSNSERHFDVNGAQFGMKHVFAKQGEEWTLDGSYFGVTAGSTSLYTTDYYTGAPGTPIKETTYQQTLGTASPSFFTAQTDYTDPIGKNSKLEAGLRASIQNLDNDNNTYTLDGHGNSTLDSLGASNFKSTSRVYAAYVNFTSKIGNFGYALGLRGESSNYSGDLLNPPPQHFHNSYPVSIFPTLFLSQKLKGDQELQLSATRKINRPGFFQLIPYTDYSDSLNITRGNPNLVPEFTGSFELSYIKNFKGGNTLLVSGYYKYTGNLITRYQDSAANPLGKPVLINTYENANNAYTAGAEVTTTNNVTKWWDMTLNLNLYNSHINTDNLKQPSQPALWTWFGKWNSNFKLPANFTIQVTALYQAKTNIPVNQQQNQFAPPGSTTQSSSQGYIKPSYGFDLAVKKSFLKNNAASLTVSMSDIFRTRWSDQYSTSPFFNQEYDRLKDPQLLRVVFSYRFGKMDLNIFKRKDMNQQGMGDAGQSL